MFLYYSLYYLILILILIYGYFGIKTDIFSRKISNNLNYSFFIISIILFLSQFKKYSLYDYFGFMFIFVISYLAYRFGFWAAADGKLFINIAILTLSLLNYNSIFNLIINILILYSIVILFLVIFKTKLNHKLHVMKNLDYGLKIFQLIVIFSIMSIFYNFFILKEISTFYLLLLLAYFIILYIIITPISKKIYLKLDDELKFFLNFILFLLLFLFSKEIFIYYFITVMLFKVFLDFTSKSTENIKINGVEYSSPFSIYIFAGALITIITNSNILLIIIKFFV